MTPRTVLVTGAAGFVGQHLLPALRAAFPGARLIGGSRTGSVAGADEVLPISLEDPASLRAAVRATKPDACVHLAARTEVPASFADPSATWRANLDGTLALASALLEDAPDCQFVFASSSEVYGRSFQSGAPLDESALLAPANPYAASKAAADLALGEMAMRGLRAVRMRVFTHTGPGQSPSFAVPAFARQIALIEAGLQEPEVRVGALDRWRDYLDVQDVCAAYVAAIRHGWDLPPGAILNIASGVPRRIGDVLQALLAQTRVAVEVREDASRLRPTDLVRVVGDASRAQHALAWSPKVPFEATLAEVLAYWRRRVAAGRAA